MKIASIQLEVFENDKAAALDAAEQAVAANSDADLVILPEIWNVGFMSFDAYHSESEDESGPTLSLMKTLAQQHRIHLHTGSFVEKQGNKYYNSSFLLSPEGEILAKYRKIHLFGYGSRETALLSPGNEPVVVDTPLGTFGLATCFDLRCPELFRAMVDQGAGVFLVCSAWPYPRLDPWRILNRARALENQAFLISANSTGVNSGSRFVGHSMVADPYGHILAGAGDDPAVIRTEIDVKAVERARQEFPGLAGRRKFLNPPLLS